MLARSAWQWEGRDGRRAVGGGKKRAKAGSPTCAVQIRDATLSRRMCYSRACVAMRRRARRPCASTDRLTPTPGEEVRRGAGGRSSSDGASPHPPTHFVRAARDRARPWHEAASVRPADAACSPAFEALLRRAHGYCVCVASRQAGL